MMNTQEQELLGELRAAFAGEVVERLQSMTTDLLELEKGGSSDDVSRVLEHIYRTTHNLKGEARAVNFMDLETLCQAIESVFAAWKKNGIPSDHPAYDTLYAAVDMIPGMVSNSGAADPASLAAVIQRASRLMGEPHRDAESTPSDTRPPGGGSTSESPASMNETVRMPIARLETMMVRLEEMLTVKLTTRRRSETLREVLAVVEQWKREGERLFLAISDTSVEAGLSPRVGEWMTRSREVVGRLQAMVSVVSQDTDQDDHAVSQLVDSLLDESKKLLMLPCNSLLGILPKVVRDLGQEQGKKVAVVIRGGDIEVDKRMLQELKDVVIHMVRNCVDHGIEKTEVRMQRNKPLTGTIDIEVLATDSGKVEWVVRDDGGGVDVEAVKAAAVRLGVVSAAQAAHLSQEESVALIFRSAVSTSPVVTSVSGRGLGMAIVKERVEKLGGRIFVETKAHEGSVFRMVLPLTLATFRGTFVEIGDRCFIIPSAGVERVGRIGRDQVAEDEGRSFLNLPGLTAPFIRLSDVLEISMLEQGTDPLLVYVLLRDAAGRRVAFGVDRVLMEDEVLVKPFLKPLSRVRHVAGATILASGKVVPVLHVGDIMKKSAKPIVMWPSLQPCGPAAAASQKRVLVVEDSIISRMLFKSILESVGYVVKTTVDGEEAWDALQSDDYDVVVTDVEMPRLDGFGLTSRIRGDPRVADKPVILITGRSAPEDRVRGMGVGANAYIVKSSFDQSDLLEALRRVL